MAQVSPQLHTDSPPLAAPLATGTPRRGRVLVVEDRDDVRLGLAELLELNGFPVGDAATAEQGLAALEAHPTSFALILLDLMLPGAMSGVDLRARQLANPALAGIPTVVLSASDESAEALARMRPAAWLEKPFSCDLLMRIVRQYVVPEEGRG